MKWVKWVQGQKVIGNDGWPDAGSIIVGSNRLHWAQSRLRVGSE